MESSKSESLSLSLIEVEGQHSLPLRFYDPKVSTECKLLTRSPRSVQSFDVPMSHDCLRRSPRFSNAGSFLSGPDGQTPKRSHRFDLPKMVLNGVRRSPRLVSDDSTNSDAFTPKRSRRSPHAPTNKMETSTSSDKIQKKKIHVSYLVGEPIPDEEAQERWRWRYDLKIQRSNGKGRTLDDDDEDKIVSNVECHYVQAQIDECIFNLGDCAIIKGEGAQKHVGRILEFFRTTDGDDYFRVQWFYRAEDTVMKEAAAFHDSRRLFYSTVMNDNPVDCIVSKVSITQIPPKIGLKSNSIPPSGFYFDMEYCVEYSTFRTLPSDKSLKIHELSLPHCLKNVTTAAVAHSLENIPNCGTCKAELVLLDLYSGCGGMSTGLCLGAKLSSINLVTKWAVDSDKSACESLRLNHPETRVWNEKAEDFLQLLKEWQKLCIRYEINNVEREHQLRSVASIVGRTNVTSTQGADVPLGEFEVGSLVDVCYGDPNKTGKRRLNFKVHWKGYSSSEDTWEPIEGLSNCQDRIQDFVRKGHKSKILPLPGDVDVICGGPPCQGISGYNRYRNVDSPLDDERNRQIVIFMNIVEFLKPMFVLMENVVDILRFDKASLGRYALSRLVHMKYQARLGIIAAGCYGLPQFRLRVFLWGALPNVKLPQFPLPTHDVIVRYWPPPEFERNTVAYDEDQPRDLEKALVLQDAISDLPIVTSHEAQDEMSYGKPPETEFQRFMRSSESEVTGSAFNGTAGANSKLYDHRPYPLSEDDYIRVCLIPKRKGANFRDLPGVVVGIDNVARRDPTSEQMLLPSGKPMVPDYALSFEQGKSKRPFARLWWDETVPTIVTFPALHSMAVLHPEQDRVLTIRECARLQGFPDYYRFCGTVKARYCQVGNAVPVFVARTLGYALGIAYQKLSGDEPLMTLPPKFSHSTNLQLAKSLQQKTECQEEC
ncbi:hypothetical protein Ddye_001190 [Dipteronia dyeriana]|uniref:DNA (cytosine-5-)-methyltransferase n=1 Tax=Dipteronia dyeriana TaxID=168575 RepID=A0AAD9XNM8_9ROSI|nr:hypothetical protein Ddye_001190 [Dipteronia dyeriana]